MSWSQALGELGEEFAREMLREQGMEILETGWRSRYGEIDIIAREGEYICFVEVKTRRQDSDYPGEEAVDAAKQRKIIRTALLYMAERETSLQPRFDLFSVITDKRGRILHYDYWIGAYDSDAYTGYI